MSIWSKKKFKNDQNWEQYKVTLLNNVIQEDSVQSQYDDFVDALRSVGEQILEHKW